MNDQTDETPMRQCTKCGEWKPETTEYFYWRKDKGYLHRQCLQCEKERRRKYYWDNRDASRSYGREYHQKNRDSELQRHRDYWAKNRDARREYRQKTKVRRSIQTRAYREVNSEKIRQQQRTWYLQNKEDIRVKNRRHYIENKCQYQKRHAQWRKVNGDKQRVYQTNRRARQRNAPGNHTAADLRLQAKAQTNRKGQLICWWCGKPIKGAYHADHVIPLARGGSNNPENIVLAHPRCNLSKQDKLPQEWIGRLF